MKAQDLKAGDQVSDDNGNLVFTLIDDAAIRNVNGRSAVIATVKEVSGGGGGRDFRVWDVDQDVPLVRRESSDMTYTCPHCHRKGVRVTKDGYLYTHKDPAVRYRCDGSGMSRHLCGEPEKRTY